MQVKKTIQYIRNSQYILVIFFVPLGLMLAAKWHTAFALAVELTLAIICILIYLTRSVVANRILRKSADPGLAYAVLEKLGVTQTFNLSLPDEPSTIPAYSTKDFLAENDLRPKIDLDLSFEEAGLNLDRQLIPWKDVYDWNYIKKGKTTVKIVVAYYDNEDNLQEKNIYLTLGRNKVDLLLLFIHYKAKYGQAK